MKKILLVLVSFWSSFIFSQELKIEEPEFVGQIFYVDSNNKSFDLEFQTCAVKTGQSTGRLLTGIGKIKARLIVKGKESSTIIKKTESITFIYNNGDNLIVPTKVVRLLQFEVDGNNRQYIISNVSNVSGQSTSMDLNYIKYQAKKFGNGSYLIVLNNLPVGEYAFFLGEKASNDAYLFSVVE